MLPAAAAYECLRRTWPGLEEVDVQGWTARFSRGGYNRVNSVLPGHFWQDGDPDEAIAEVERLYRSRGLAPTFQVIEGSAPDGLDEMLAARNYAPITPSHVLAKRVTRRSAIPGVDAAETAAEDWLAAYLATLDRARTAECLEIFTRLPEPHAWFTCRQDGQVAGIGLASFHEGCVGIDCILTRPEVRRRGLGTRVLESIEAWAGAAGATWLVLAVVADNTPAVALYHRLGYDRIGGYTYRVAG